MVPYTLFLGGAVYLFKQKEAPPEIPVLTHAMVQWLSVRVKYVFISMCSIYHYTLNPSVSYDFRSDNSSLACMDYVPMLEVISLHIFMKAEL